MILLLGVGKSVLKQFYVDNCNCSNCKQKLQHRFTVYGHYFSFFFVPVIPLFKKTTSECVHCRYELSKNSWNADLTEKFNRVVAIQPPKRPWWHFLGCFVSLLIVLFFSILIGYAIYTVKDDPEFHQLKEKFEQIDSYEEIVDSSVVLPLEPGETQEPIDSITSFFKNK
jgi:hypothetical protein